MDSDTAPLGLYVIVGVHQLHEVAWNINQYNRFSSLTVIVPSRPGL